MFERDTDVIGVIGQGYVGLEVSVQIASRGHKVIGFERDLHKVQMITSGVSPIENVSTKSLTAVIGSGKLEITSDMSRLSECSAVLICVPTPLKADLNPDLEMLNSAVSDIAAFVSEDTLIVNESTSFPGTLRNFVASKIFDKRPDLVSSLKFGVAPERVSPGNGIPLSEVERVVSGLDEEAKSLTQQLYSIFCKNVTLVDSPEIAEASKLLENTFRQVNIAFINEFNLICRRLNIDTRKVIDAANTKPYGFMAFQPSSGIGGHCIPVDPLYFQYVARQEGLESEFIELATKMNHEHPRFLLDRVLASSGKENVRVLLLGVAYKSGLSDTRESPAERFLELLTEKEIDFGWFDPLVSSWMNTQPADIQQDWDIAIVITAQENLPVDDLVRRGVNVFDSTGTFNYNSKVNQI